MIPTIGIIIAVYAIARLSQVPLEILGKSPPGSLVHTLVLLISAGAILIIAVLAVDLLLSGANRHVP